MKIPKIPKSPLWGFWGFGLFWDKMGQMGLFLIFPNFQISILEIWKFGNIGKMCVLTHIFKNILGDFIKTVDF